MTGTPNWMFNASCRGSDPALWFPVRGEPTDEAKKMCAGCPVRADCLAYALAHNEKVGIYGGTSERQRRAIRGARTIRTAVCRECGRQFSYPPLPAGGVRQLCSEECRLVRNREKNRRSRQKGRDRARREAREVA